MYYKIRFQNTLGLVLQETNQYRVFSNKKLHSYYLLSSYDYMSTLARPIHAHLLTPNKPKKLRKKKQLIKNFKT